ncbi:hypothetical protein ACHHV8_10085 [Paenibacillus sp. TAB 01]|uniref:hypothetical protein n=1 Tax=Paenibacillus sp. TAB 01 TaxID=3368988 RepID=UPI0037503218
MQRWDVGLARLLKQPPGVQAVSLGVVVSVSPIRVSLGDFLLEADQLMLSSRLNDLVVADRLSVGDAVVLLTSNFQQFVVADKIGGGLLDTNE